MSLLNAVLLLLKVKGARVMLSTPPAINKLPSSQEIARAASIIAAKLLPQSLLTVCPLTSTGKPAANVA